MVELLGTMNVLAKGKVEGYVPKNTLSRARYKIGRSAAINNRDGWQ
jgi:hypothetical protein